jgi:hypothetical protein
LKRKTKKQIGEEAPKQRQELSVREITCAEFWENYLDIERAVRSRFFPLDWESLNKNAELLLHEKQCRRCLVIAKEYEEVYRKTQLIIQGERRKS